MKLRNKTAQSLTDGRLKPVRGKIGFEALKENQICFKDTIMLYDADLIDYTVLKEYYDWYWRENRGENSSGRYLREGHVFYLSWCFYSGWMKAAAFNHKCESGGVSADETSEIKRFINKYGNLYLKIAPCNNKCGFKIAGNWKKIRTGTEGWEENLTNLSFAPGTKG
jgi:hypothetical protein